MIHIVGQGVVKEMDAFNDVKGVLSDGFDVDVYLGAFMATPLKVELKNKAIYNMEYLHDRNPLFMFGYMETLKNNFVIDYSVENVKYLAKHGVEAFYMPYGYAKCLERRKEEKQDIDILFVGSTHHPRRLEVLDKLKRYFNVVVADGVYGDDLDHLIARAKVHLNMHHAENQPLEVVRINYLMANGCNIVSEKGSDANLDSKYKDGLLFAEYAELIDACVYALKNKIDGTKVIRNIPHDCFDANLWVKDKLCLQ